jgi:hypothetical protein
MNIRSRTEGDAFANKLDNWLCAITGWAAMKAPPKAARAIQTRDWAFNFMLSPLWCRHHLMADPACTRTQIH